MDNICLYWQSVCVISFGIFKSDEDRKNGDAVFYSKAKGADLERTGLSVIIPHCLLGIYEDLFSSR